MVPLYPMTNSQAYGEGIDHQLTVTYVCAEHRAYLEEWGSSDTYNGEPLDIPGETCALCPQPADEARHDG